MLSPSGGLSCGRRSCAIGIRRLVYLDRLAARRAGGLAWKRWKIGLEDIADQSTEEDTALAVIFGVADSVLATLSEHHGVVNITVL
jgi:hypothetical protein